MRKSLSLAAAALLLISCGGGPSFEHFPELEAKEGVQWTDSGLLYEVVTEGSGPKPTLASRVTVHYEGKFTDGKVFDSSYARGEPITFPVTGVVPGWTEALQLMTAGSTYMLYLPPELGYGERGKGQIAPNTPLVFKVELLAVN